MTREIPFKPTAILAVVSLAFFLSVSTAADDNLTLLGSDKGRNVSAEGEITAVSAGEISVGGVTFKITAETKIIGGTFDDLAIGVTVSVKGQKAVDGNVYAKTIKIKDKPDRNRNRKRMAIGVITDIGDGFATVSLDTGDTFDISPDQKIMGRHGLNANASNLHVGLTLHVRYVPYKETPESGAVGKATSLRVRGKENVKGFIQEEASPTADLPSIDVGGETCYYDDITVVIGARENVTAPGELAVGTSVHVLSNPLADGSHLANKVAVDNASDRSGKLQRYKGTVNGISSEGGELISFTVNDETFLVDENTVFNVAKYDGPFPVELFEVDLKVIVKAKPQADGSLLALWIRVVLPDYVYCGEIEAVGSDSITLLGKQITVTEYTAFVEFDVEDMSLEDLGPGDKIEVLVLLWPDGTLLASKIKSCDDDNIHVRGPIETITPDGDDLKVKIAGVEMTVTAETVIGSKDGMFAAADLKTGMYVDAWGAYDESDNLIAFRIKVR